MNIVNQVLWLIILKNELFRVSQCLIFIDLGCDKENTWRMGSYIHEEKFFSVLEISISGPVQGWDPTSILCSSR
jgi:hypothetical protein